MDERERLKGVIDALLSKQQAPQDLTELRRLEEEERERNRRRELANILGSGAARVTGATPISDLALDNTAKKQLMQALAGRNTGNITDRDRLNAALQKYSQAEINARQEEGLKRRDKSLEQGQQKIGQTQQKIEQPSEKTAKEFATLDTLQSELDSALADLDKQTSREDLKSGLIDIPATGLLRNLLEGAKSLGEEIGVSSPDVELGSLKAKIAGFSAEKLREKFGAQVTVQEMDKVKPYIPLPGDTPTEVRTKIKNLKREIGIIIKDRKKALESTGRKFSETKEKPKPAEVLIPKSDSDLDSMTDEQLEAYINEGK